MWGVLCADAESARLGEHAEPLRDALEGVVVVSRHAAAPAGTPCPADDTRLAGLLAGLREVPDDVALVALIEVDGIAADGPELVAKMRARLTDDTAAVVRGAPVTDALKRVNGAAVLEGVSRTGLFVPQTPQLLRREALDAALARGAGAATDPATLLLSAGFAVDVLWGSPLDADGPGA